MPALSRVEDEILSTGATQAQVWISYRPIPDAYQLSYPPRWAYRGILDIRHDPSAISTVSATVHIQGLTSVKASNYLILCLHSCR